MLDSGIVDVAIGLIFVFSLLAILVTQINTFLGNVLNWRAKTLKTGLQQLLTDKEIQAKVTCAPSREYGANHRYILKKRLPTKRAQGNHRH